MRLLVTGGSGVLGRALRPLAEAAGHDLQTPNRTELDLFDPIAVERATRDADAVMHLATRIQPLEQLASAEAWRENDRLRADASRILVDGALSAGVSVYVQPTVTFVYPPEGSASEDTPIGEVSAIKRSALAALHVAGALAALCSLRSRFQVGSTTSAVPASAYPTASRTPPGGSHSCSRGPIAQGISTLPRFGVVWVSGLAEPKDRCQTAACRGRCVLRADAQ
jgi:NAD dependent epimerase/dehydratase family